MQNFAGRLFLALLTCLLLALPGPAAAQTVSDDAALQAHSDDWTKILDRVEQQLDRVEVTVESASRLLEITKQVRGEAQRVVAGLQPRIDSIERRLEAMGPLPVEGAAAESTELTQRRAVLTGQAQLLKDQLGQARLALVRVEELDEQIGKRSQRTAFEALLREYPAPWAVETWRTAVPEFVLILKRIANSPLAWWQGLEAEERRQTVSLRIAAQLLLALAVGWFLRHWLLRHRGRDPGLSDPSYSLRLVAAIASAVARGIVPALIFAGLLYLTWPYYVAGEYLFWSVVATFFAVMVFFSLAWAVPYAILSPDLPQWRLLPVSPENARKLGWRFTLLAALFAFAIFMVEAQDRIGVSYSYFSASTFILTILLTLPVIDISRQTYWKRALASVAGHVPADGAEAVAEEPPQSGLWRSLGRLVASIAVISIVAALLGYSDLADFLVGNLLKSVVVLVAIAILRSLTHELIGASMRSSVMSTALALRHVVRNRLKFWLRLLLDTVLVAAGILAIGAIWVGRFVEFWFEVGQVFSGFTIGGVTISFYDLLVALALFTAVLTLTRLGQRFLSNRVLPQTGFDAGVQNSLSAGFGYIGIILAAIFGISALGIDLSNIALIAGALSVGIGFGLQTVVSNFVSGVILLIERPIKLGDWVMVGSNEGLVKRITVRSTELQTFQRASVIIPNSEFISTSVINWTHKDTYGRIEVPVGVAYGSDVEKVREVLLNCAQHHERVLTSPEPQVIFMNFGNSSLDFELRCFTNDVSYRLIISSDLRFAIDKAFREAGIEIPFPQHVIHFADPAAPREFPKIAVSDAEPKPES